MVSVIIPSIRDTIHRLVKEIRLNAGIEDYEVIVVSPNPIRGVVWVKDRRRGSLVAIRDGFQYAKGSYVMFMPDDILPQKDFLKNMVSVMSTHDYKDIGDFALYRENGEPEGGVAEYGEVFARYPFLSRKAIEEFGFVNKDLRHFYGDPEICIRFRRKGGRIITVHEARMTSLRLEDNIHQKAVNKHFEHDKKIFKRETGLG